MGFRFLGGILGHTSLLTLENDLYIDFFYDESIIWILQKIPC